MSTEMNSTEVESALSTIFEKLGEMDNRCDAIDSAATRALSMALSAKEAVGDIDTVPTNGWDLACLIGKGVIGLATTGIVCWCIVRCWVGYPNKEKK